MSAAPVVCPLQGPYSLAYGKVDDLYHIDQDQEDHHHLDQDQDDQHNARQQGGADRQCSHPPSLMDTCNDDSVIQIKYQVGTKFQVPSVKAKYPVSSTKCQVLSVKYQEPSTIMHIMQTTNRCFQACPDVEGSESLGEYFLLLQILRILTLHRIL